MSVAVRDAGAADARPVAFAVPGRLDTLTGGFLYDRRIIEGLRERGRQVEAIELPEGFPLAGPRLHEAAMARLADLPDGRVLVVDGLAAGVLPEAMVRLAARLPLHILVHHPLAAENGLSDEQVRRLYESERTALAAARRVITTSKATAERLSRDYGVPAERLTAVPPGTTSAPLSLGSGGDTPHLLCVGSLIPRKGQDLLVEALAALTALPWRLSLAGGARDPAFAEQLRARVSALDLTERIAFLGELAPERLARVYAEADLYLQPSRLEGYGMAIAEALARGLPVLCTEAAAIVGELPPGCLATIPADDGQRLQERLRSLLDTPQERRRLATAARRGRDLLLSWTDAAEAFERALAETPTARGRDSSYG